MRKFRNPSRRELATRYRLLCDWYGETAAKTEMAARCPAARPINELVEQLGEAFTDPELRWRLEIERQWARIAGAEAGQWVKLSAFRDGVLLLEVRHAALLREFSCCADLWQQRVNQVLGRPGLCREVKFVPAGRSR